jgi:NCAIR mutase (PurE)-related protein
MRVRLGAVIIARQTPISATEQRQTIREGQLLRRLRHDDANGIVSVDNYAQVDVARAERTGFPEAVFGEGKTAVQIAEIFATLAKSAPDKATLASRVSSEKWQEIQPLLAAAGLHNVEYHTQARMVVWRPDNARSTSTRQPKPCVIAAGTSDLPVAEEACVTLDASGYPPMRIYDVGVAGIHRLFAKLGEIRSADVVIVVAGMDGALPSVVMCLSQMSRCVGACVDVIYE